MSTSEEAGGVGFLCKPGSMLEEDMKKQSDRRRKMAIVRQQMGSEGALTASARQRGSGMLLWSCSAIGHLLFISLLFQCNFFLS